MNHINNRYFSITGASRKLALAGLFVLALMPLRSLAIDVDAGDFVPAPSGTTVGLLYLQHADRDRYYSQGNESLSNPRLKSDIGIARLIHYTEIGGMTVAPQILVPFGRENASGGTSSLGNANGVGDVILTAPFWLVNSPQSRTYFALAPYIYLPVGNYDRNKTLNIGENRWKYNLQGGLVKGFTDSFFVDVTADAMFYGKNNDYGSTSATLKQDPLYQIQTYLRYQFTPGTNAFVGFSQNWGGKTEVNGTTNDDAAEQRKFSVGGSYFILPKTQLLLTVGRDIKVENGFKENARVNFRVMQIF